MNPLVTLEEDDWTRERYYESTRWLAWLSDGSRVIQDDGRPGRVKTAWERLGQHVRENAISVVKFAVEFRSHREEPLPENAPGYFFRRALLASTDMPVPFGYYLMGWLDEQGKLTVQRWKIPELLKEEEEERDPSQSGPSLILRKGISLANQRSGQDRSGLLTP